MRCSYVAVGVQCSPPPKTNTNCTDPRHSVMVREVDRSTSNHFITYQVYTHRRGDCFVFYRIFRIETTWQVGFLRALTLQWKIKGEFSFEHKYAKLKMTGGGISVHEPSNIKVRSNTFAHGQFAPRAKYRIIILRFWGGEWIYVF